MHFWYVYILESLVDAARHYTGITGDLAQRLKAHNAGQSLHTAKFKPRRIKTAIAFSDHTSAVRFEAYLKSPSGRAFAKKRL